MTGLAAKSSPTPTSVVPLEGLWGGSGGAGSSLSPSRRPSDVFVAKRDRLAGHLLAAPPPPCLPPLPSPSQTKGTRSSLSPSQQPSAVTLPRVLLRDRDARGQKRVCGSQSPRTVGPRAARTRRHTSPSLHGRPRGRSVQPSRPSRLTEFRLESRDAEGVDTGVGLIRRFQ